MVWRLTIILLFSLCATRAAAQPDSIGTYTEARPLVYEDPTNLWPFSFENEEGEPDGFNIDLVRLVMDELKIPYVIRLKPHQDVLRDLKDGQSDLTLGPTGVFYNMYSLYGRSTVMLLTQSIATPRHQPVRVRNFRDLGQQGQRVIVSDSSLCHHLMIDYGWKANALPTKDMSETLRLMSKKGEGQVVWNTVSLKWLIGHYGLANIELTPVNMPHGEYKYMSNDQRLLDLVDKAYAKLCAEGRLAPLEAKWFYPERQSQQPAKKDWYLAGAVVLLLAATLLLIRRAMQHYRRTADERNRLSQELAQVAENSKVRIWTYDVATAEVTWYDANGAAASTHSIEEFARRYSKEDFKLLREALDRLISQHKDKNGHEEQEVTLELKAKDGEHGDSELHDFVIVLAVKSHDKDGRPETIIATKRDVTKERRLRQTNNERSLRYWSVFYNNDAGVVLFDECGVIVNANPKACHLFQCDVDMIVEEKTHINHMLHTEIGDLREADGQRGTLTMDNNTIEYELKTVYNDEGALLGIFVFCL